MVLVERADRLLDARWNLYGHMYMQITINDEGQCAMHKGVIAGSIFLVTQELPCRNQTHKDLFLLPQKITKTRCADLDSVAAFVPTAFTVSTFPTPSLRLENGGACRIPETANGIVLRYAENCRYPVRWRFTP